jgi:predicted O-linked N-acetylglucosamine transferase (SPINDLY family)
MSASALRKLQQAHHKMQSGELSAAALLCDEVLARAPRNPDALWLLGTIRVMTGEAQAAVPLLERATGVAPGHGAALEMLGLAHLMLSDFAAAERVLREALAIPGAPPSVRMRFGIALLRQGRHAEASRELARVTELEPGNADAHLNLGLSLAGGSDWAGAARAFERVLEREPHHPDALFNLGVARLEQGDREGAREGFEQILARTPGYTDARERLAAMHLAVGRFREAATHLRELTRAQPDNAAALNALANACFQCGAIDEAEQAARRAQAIDPSLAGSYTLLAQVHFVRGALDEAAAVLEKGYEATRAGVLLGTLVHLLHRMCDWKRWRAAWTRMAAALEEGADLGSPFNLLCEDTTPAQQLAYTKRWAAARFESTRSKAPQTRAPRDGRRLRIGYFSSDFQEHPAAYLLAEVLEQHDRSRYEVHAYSYGPDDSSAMRQRLRAAVEHFVDVAWDPDDAVLRRMRDDDLDLLVDLKGYTMGDRLSVMAGRPAPVQATWLGYPGTSGADFIDYVIADGYVIPPGAEDSYSEQVLRLPHCYQANDRKRPAVEPLTRTEYGLPEEGFVFCCFNQAVKITPEVFSRWMRLLQRVPASVLWLPEDNRWASVNLAAAAEAEGVAAGRVVFGPRLGFGEHLARYRAADLALDTFPYTSHTTASDGLWMGCPLVGLCGETFAARVSASILANCGLPDLVTDTLDDYEALAYRLATDADYMSEVRRRVIAARDAAPLFDSTRFIRDLEALYSSIVK